MRQKGDMEKNEGWISKHGVVVESVWVSCELQASRSAGRWSMAPPAHLGLRGSGVTRGVFASVASD